VFHSICRAEAVEVKVPTAAVVAEQTNYLHGIRLSRVFCDGIGRESRWSCMPRFREICVGIRWWNKVYDSMGVSCGAVTSNYCNQRLYCTASRSPRRTLTIGILIKGQGLTNDVEPCATGQNSGHWNVTSGFEDALNCRVHTQRLIKITATPSKPFSPIECLKQ